MRRSQTLAALLLGIVLLLGFQTELHAVGPDPVARFPGSRQAPADSGYRPVPVPRPTRQAIRYHQTGNLLWIVDTTLAVLIPAAFLFTGFSARLRARVARRARRRLATIVLYFIAYLVLVSLIRLPLDYYEGFVREHAYGLSHQALSKWLGDWGKGVVVSAMAGALVIWIPYLLLETSPRRWWWYSGLAAVPLLSFFLLLAPVWVDPWFNQFGPLPDKALEARILTLARRAGIERGRVYLVNKSVDTQTLNAYVTGFGQSKRIVLWDTALEKLDRDELLFVMGHEMGHYVLHHVIMSIVIVSLLVMGALFFVHRTAAAVIRRFRGRLGFETLSDPASLPLLMLLGGIAAFAVTPLALALFRHHEHEADRFALELTRDNEAGARTFAKLLRENLGIPRPGLFYQLWRGSHPSLGDRIDFANGYRPWEHGDPLRYGHYFRRGR